MSGFPLFPRSKPRRFNYRPVWYDPAEAERRREDICGSAGAYRPGERLQRMRERRMAETVRKECGKRRQRRSARLFVWLLLVLGCVYLILKSRLPESLVQVLID